MISQDVTATPDTDDLFEQAAHLWLACHNAPEDAALRETARTWAAQSHDHARAWQTAEKVWGLTGQMAPAPAYVPASANIIPFRPTRRQIGAVTLTALAACLALAIAPTASLWLKADYRTGVGETRTLTLADGSQVQLDTNSAIAVDAFGETRRVHLLKGRAFFAVSKDKAHPFTVEAADTTVTVTGTQFYVALAPTAVDVALSEGSVNFDHKGGQNRLTPGDRVHYGRDTRTAKVTRMAVADMSAWRRGRLLIEGDRLSAIVDQIRPYHRGVIWVTDARLARQPVTGVFDLNDPVEALRLAVAPHGGRVTQISPWVIVVSGA
ncbi:FecR family protein [Asticcacaulis sp. W401b]|uniref:FecR family protein n=1 Tax=Asticcacaulis sp. W401b TaxID=3388666 RepID=UPI00397082E9